MPNTRRIPSPAATRTTREVPRDLVHIEFSRPRPDVVVPDSLHTDVPWRVTGDDTIEFPSHVSEEEIREALPVGCRIVETRPLFGNVTEARVETYRTIASRVPVEYASGTVGRATLGRSMSLRELLEVQRYEDEIERRVETRQAEDGPLSPVPVLPPLRPDERMAAFSHAEEIGRVSRAFLTNLQAANPPPSSYPTRFDRVTEDDL